MTSVPRPALGPLHQLAPLLGDPRVRMTGLFLRMGHNLPDRYPFVIDIETSLAREHSMARAIGYGVIGPRLDLLYDWSADVLDEPDQRGLITDGNPGYALQLPRRIWHPPKVSLIERVVRRALPVRNRHLP